MTTTQAKPKKMEKVEPIELSDSASENSRGIAAATELNPADQSWRSDPGTRETDSGIDGFNLSDVPPTPVVSTRPQRRPMNVDRPVRYIPIHVWPEHLKKVQPRTGRRYCPKRSRTMPKRNGPSPLVREYQYAEYESDVESTQSCDAGNVGGSPAKRRGWGHALLDAVQNAVPKRPKEDKEPHTTPPRRSLSLTPFRLGHHPPGLKKPGSREKI